jgi:hypothetical protein
MQLMRVRDQLRENSSVSDMYSLEVARPLMTRHSVVATPVDTAVQAPVHVAEEASDSGRQQCLCVESSTEIEPATHPYHRCAAGSQRLAAPHVPTRSRR